jgi:hypothetical protein
VLSGELALHEIGHSFAGLADEYEEELPGYPDVESANATRQTTRETIRWRTWISDDVPVPTPKTAFYQDTIGLFEGAYFHPRGWYRPKMDCRMRNLSKPFCEICREAHVLTIYQLVEPILNSTPAPNNVTVPGGGELELFLETIEPASGTIGYTWTVNGATNEHFMGNFFTASFDTLGTGSHLVRANVSDTTAFVRNDPSARLSDSRNWLVTVVAPTNVPPVISEITDIVLELPQQSFGSVGFTVDDPDTPWHELQFRVSSSNPNLLSQEGIDIVGGKFGQFIQVHPDAGKTGLATVTLQISDGTTEVTQLFNVIVADAYSDLVLEPIFDQKVFLGPVAVSLSISRTSTSSLQFYGSSSNPEVVADSDISFEAVEERWIVHIHPEAEGETTLIVSVTDGIETAARSFQLTFVARPKVTSEMPRMTTEGLLVEFNTDIPATMILEYSMDLVFWMPVTSEADVTKLLYVAPESKTTNAEFYRVRVLPR